MPSSGGNASKLPGFGGVYNASNLNLYAYGHQNPVKYSDADGNVVFIPIIVGAIWVADKAYAAYEAHQDYKAIQSGAKTFAEVAKDRAAEQVAGAVAGPIGRGAAKAGKHVLKMADEVTSAGSSAAKKADDGVIYREGDPSPSNLKTREGEEALSFRDSLSNPIESKDRPVLRPDKKYFGIDTQKLPAGSVVRDNVPPGHVSVKGVDPQTLKDAVVERGKFPE